MLQKAEGRKQKAFQTDDMEVNMMICAKSYHIFCMNCAYGIVFGL